MARFKAKCPKDETHKKFVTSAHVSQDWVVDETGEWVNTLTEVCEVTAGPDEGNLWTCLTCGEEAEVSDS